MYTFVKHFYALICKKTGFQDICVFCSLLKKTKDKDGDYCNIKHRLTKDIY